MALRPRCGSTPAWAETPRTSTRYCPEVRREETTVAIALPGSSTIAASDCFASSSISGLLLGEPISSSLLQTNVTLW